VERIDVGLALAFWRMGDGLALHRPLVWGLRCGRYDVTEHRSAVVRGHVQAAYVRDFPNPKSTPVTSAVAAVGFI
jgi:hypothetical protein